MEAQAPVYYSFEVSYMEKLRRLPLWPANFDCSSVIVRDKNSELRSGRNFEM
jgi:hypothetical protein